MSPPPSTTGERPAPRLRIVVADDDPVVRAGLTALLHQHPDLVVVAGVADGPAAREAVALHRPDVVLLDVRTRFGDGLDALPHLARIAPVLTLTHDGTAGAVREARRRGACGHLVHGEFTAGQLAAAVRDAAAGRPVSGPAASDARTDGARGAAEFTRRPSLSQSNVGHSSTEPGPAALDRSHGVVTALSRREVEVMELIASGLTNQQIAASCFISHKTVKNHINRIFAKLNAGNRGEAIAVWRELPGPAAGREVGP
ncbi:response regulator transcription factor [Streptomyces sp. NPDC048057]|uniref:response regulator transcription factor n=1 Tax=Streptomyces sp. NPDC048057 TaxID=3155628 RepID=UPI0033EF6A44